MVNGTKIVGKNLIHKKNIDPKYYSSNFYDIKINKYGVKCGTYLI